MEYEWDLVTWLQHEMVLKEPDAYEGNPSLIEYPEVFWATDVHRVGIATMEVDTIIG